MARRLAAELDLHPEAALAYPLTVRIDDAGSEYPTRERLFDTAGLTNPRARLRRVAGDLRGAGELVYGLMRRSAIGPFPVAMLADRLFLARLALEGEFRQVHEPLWYRRFRAGVRMTNARQRRSTWPDGAPLRAYVPWWLTHPLLSAGPTAPTPPPRPRGPPSRASRSAASGDLRWRKRHALERLGREPRVLAPLDRRPRSSPRQASSTSASSCWRRCAAPRRGGRADLHGRAQAGGARPLLLAAPDLGRLRRAQAGPRSPARSRSRGGEPRHLVGRRRLLPD